MEFHLHVFNVVCGRITLVGFAVMQLSCQCQVCCQAEQRVLAEEYASWVARLAVLLAIRRPRQACFHVLVAVGFVELIPVGSVGREFHRRGRARELFEFGRQRDISNQLYASAITT